MLLPKYRKKIFLDTSRNYPTIAWAAVVSDDFFLNLLLSKKEAIMQTDKQVQDNMAINRQCNHVGVNLKGKVMCIYT